MHLLTYSLSRDILLYRPHTPSRAKTSPPGQSTRVSLGTGTGTEAVSLGKFHHGWISAHGTAAAPTTGAGDGLTRGASGTRRGMELDEKKRGRDLWYQDRDRDVEIPMYDLARNRNLCIVTSRCTSPICEGGTKIQLHRHVCSQQNPRNLLSPRRTFWGCSTFQFPFLHV